MQTLKDLGLSPDEAIAFADPETTPGGLLDPMDVDAKPEPLVLPEPVSESPASLMESPVVLKAKLPRKGKGKGKPKWWIGFANRSR